MTLVCPVLESIDAAISCGDELQYENTYKVLGKILYSNPQIKMSFAFNGPSLSFLKEKHPEFLCLLQEFLSRAQVEIIGGGYYDPVFPLLLPRERTAQIDMLTSAIAHETGKRPHTAILYASSWDDSLVASLKTNGIDCVLLDSSIVDSHNLNGDIIVMSDRGKSIDIFPMQAVSKEWAANDEKWMLQAGINEKKSLNNKDDDAFAFYYTLEEMASALRDGSFLRRAEEIEKSCYAKLSTIIEARAVRPRLRAYITSGISHSMAGDASNIQEFLQFHSSSDNLYHRQTLVSILIDQYHGDKMRKKTARSCLLSSQCGSYLFGTRHASASYRMLNEAESQIRPASEAVTAIDTDEDGHDEYVCRMAFHTSVISEYCGNVVSFDAMAGRALYRYSDSLFDDYFINNDVKTPCVQYTMQKFLRGRHEVFFAGNIAIEEKAISIRKKYIATSNGFVVQYIIKNESTDAFNSRFFVRFCFFHVDKNVKSVSLDDGGVSAVQLTSLNGGVSFLIEPNENAVLEVKTGDGECPVQEAILSWQIAISSNMECEKTISFAMLVKGDDGKQRALQTKQIKEQLSLWDEEWQ